MTCQGKRKGWRWGKKKHYRLELTNGNTGGVVPRMGTQMETPSARPGVGGDQPPKIWEEIPGAGNALEASPCFGRSRLSDR